MTAGTFAAGSWARASRLNSRVERGHGAAETTVRPAAHDPRDLPSRRLRPRLPAPAVARALAAPPHYLLAPPRRPLPSATAHRARAARAPSRGCARRGRPRRRDTERGAGARDRGAPLYLPSISRVPPLHLPSISPLSPVCLPCISPLSPQVRHRLTLPDASLELAADLPLEIDGWSIGEPLTQLRLTGLDLEYSTCATAGTSICNHFYM